MTAMESYPRSLFSWGCTGHGQLGLGNIKSGQVVEPEEVVTFRKRHLKTMACGTEHTVLVARDGTVYSCGMNVCGQLGLDKEYHKPELVSMLENQKIECVCCGCAFNVVVNDKGQVFTWGDNSHGQLGIGQSNPPHSRSPKLVRELSTQCVVQVACGQNHSLALSNDRLYPTLVKTLRSQAVTYVACGESHSAVMTQDGGVFTFGEGMHGQLGHNSLQMELLPRKVFELMGCEVSQVACGRFHTLAYIPSSGRISAFGLNDNGQLGTTSRTNCLNPTTTHGPFVPASGCKTTMPSNMHKHPLYVLKHIYAGGDQSFAYVSSLQEKILPDNFANMDSSSQILTLSEKVIQNYAMVPSLGNQPPPDLIESVKKMFSSQSCLNASFLSQGYDHYRCSGRNCGVDIQCAKERFSQMSSLPNSIITDVMNSCIVKDVLPRLPTNPPDQEAIRIYLTLPYWHLFDVPEQYRMVHCPFGKALLNLTGQAPKLIDLWWEQLPKHGFLRMIKIYKDTVMHILSQPQTCSDFEKLVKQQGLHICMEMIKKMNLVNEAAGQIVPYDTFYIPQLKDKVDIRTDFIHWLHSSKSGNNPNAMLFCSYPFVFDAQAKTLILQTDAILQMQFAVDEVQRRNFLIPTIDPINPCLIFYIQRSNIVHDTIAQLSKVAPLDFKKPLKEFFMLLLRELMDPKYGMFHYYEESHLLWFNELSFEDVMMYRLIGVVCGLAIYNNTIIHLHFPLALYKKLLKKPITLEDMKQLQPAVGSGLEQVLQHEGEDVQDVFALTFEVTREVFGQIKTVELIENGSKTLVKNDNRKEYVGTYIDYVFNKSVDETFKEFSEGFHKVCGGKVLELFHPQELQAMVVGNENYDWIEFEKNTEYKGGYSAHSLPILYFWEVFHEIAEGEKRKFLLFLTGSDRIPILGMKVVKMFIQPMGGGDNFLPVAHTCFNLLDLPRYSSKDTLNKQLLTAIQHTEGFGLV